MKTAGWYHWSQYGRTLAIEYLGSPRQEDMLYDDCNAHGPFKTFQEAKKDAYKYHQAVKREAIMGMLTVRTFKARNYAL